MNGAKRAYRARLSMLARGGRRSPGQWHTPESDNESMKTVCASYYVFISMVPLRFSSSIPRTTTDFYVIVAESMHGEKLSFSLELPELEGMCTISHERMEIVLPSS